ncbi:hypothetical protein R1sor_011891 [Riccia sorocarpa]|uniref:Uncharacterized protein n=1 Tax=Riccia sorocarpa TaxID=122646 RepID=A0ABD3I274_9MARC
MRHAWFRWFVHETDLAGCRRRFWTPGTEVGMERFRGKLIELGIEAYRKLLIDPNSGFDTPSVEVEDRLRTLVLGVPGKFAENYDMWLKSPQFDKWTLLKEAYPYSSVWVLRTKESVQQTFRKRAEIWDGWFRRQPELRNPGSLSWRYKMCEPITGNTFVRFHHLTQFTRMDRTTKCGHGGSGNCFVVGVDKGTFKPYPVGDRDPRAWVAPELTREKACPDWRGRKYITFFSESTDIYAMGYILENLCGDLFSDMTPRERSTYDDEMFAKGFPTGASLPHVVHGQRLQEALDTMTTVNIANRIDHRRTAAHWETYFQEQLMVDPLVGQRPPETKPRQKKHPDGPREIGKHKL